MGPRIAPSGLCGYPIDFTVKARAPTETPSWHLPVVPIQWGLGCYERWLTSRDEVWLEATVRIAEQLIARQQRGGRHDGGWLHDAPLAHTYRLDAPWLSALPQGEGASLLVRAYRHTGQAQFADAAVRALGPMRRSVADGGVCAWLDGAPFPEEYPTTPPSFVLNGAIFALWGFRDVSVALGDPSIAAEFEDRVDALARSIDRWDTGRWSRYDLFPHRLVNVSSSAYHLLHINQLRATNLLAPRPGLAAMASRFEAYAISRRHRTEAFVRKASFRLVVPRNAVAARIMTSARPDPTRGASP